MQNDLDANYPSLDINLLGVNSYDQESGNSLATAGRDIPWLQDEDSDGNGISDLWTSWDVTPRDVVILDGANMMVGAYNLTEYDLEETENYNTLRQMLIDAASPSTAAPWQNSVNRLDVNNDTLVTPVGDVLTLINALNARTIFDAAGRLPDPPVAPNTPPPFYDVNGDGYLTPALDVLPVINYLNGLTSGEGEAAASSTIVADSGSQAWAAISSDPAATVTVLSPTWPVSGESGTSELTETLDATWTSGLAPVTFRRPIPPRAAGTSIRRFRSGRRPMARPAAGWSGRGSRHGLVPFLVMRPAFTTLRYFRPPSLPRG